MAPYGNQVTTLCSAVWSHRVGLVVVKRQYRDGREWTTQVRECGDYEKPDIYAVDIGTLLADSGFQNIDVLKVDIERAEEVVFSRNYESWIDKVDTFVIELHDEQCQEVFYNALKRGTFKFSRSGELTIVRRISANGQLFQPRSG